MDRKKQLPTVSPFIEKKGAAPVSGVDWRGLISIYIMIASLVIFLIATFCNVWVSWVIFSGFRNYQHTTINAVLFLIGIGYILYIALILLGVRAYGNLILPLIVSLLKWVTAAHNLILWMFLLTRGISVFDGFEIKVYWILVLINYFAILGPEILATNKFRLFTGSIVSIYSISFAIFLLIIILAPLTSFITKFNFLVVPFHSPFWLWNLEWLIVTLLMSIAWNKWGMSLHVFLVEKKTPNNIESSGTGVNEINVSATVEKANETEDYPVTKEKTDETFISLKKIMNLIGERFFKVSVAHPHVLAKRFPAPILVQFYFSELDSIKKEKIKTIIGDNANEHIYDTEIKIGKVVKISLYSPDIKFSEPIIKKLDSFANNVNFLAQPTDNCQSGEHKVIFSISDNKTGVEYQSEIFAVKVVDFAFDHVSRPLLSRVSAFILGIGSFAMFILAFLEQIDKTVGLTSGTAAGVLAAVVYANFYNFYQRIRPNTL